MIQSSLTILSQLIEFVPQPFERKRFGQEKDALPPGQCKGAYVLLPHPPYPQDLTPTDYSLNHVSRKASPAKSNTRWQRNITCQINQSDFLAAVQPVNLEVLGTTEI